TVVRKSGCRSGLRQAPETTWRPGCRRRDTVTVARATPSAPAAGAATNFRSMPSSAMVPARHVRNVMVIACPGAGVVSSTVIERTGGGYVCADAGAPAPTATTAATTAAATAITRLLMILPLATPAGA